jgi:hypothetical protein
LCVSLDPILMGKVGGVATDPDEVGGHGRAHDAEADEGHGAGLDG